LAFDYEETGVAAWPYDVDAEKFRRSLSGTPSELPGGHPMEDWLRRWGSPRKWQLFACACVRQAGGRLTKNGRQALELAERYADGEAVEAQLEALARRPGPPRWNKGGKVWQEVQAAQGADDAEAPHGVTVDYRKLGAASATLELCQIRRGPLDLSFAQWIGGCTAVAVTEDGDIDMGILTDLSLLLHDIFGVAAWSGAIDVGQLAPGGGTVAALARGIYHERAFGKVPLLADALEEAGCVETAVLDHCRKAGPHVRGCWVVDLLLGKT
jgi:hypothetical protein